MNEIKIRKEIQTAGNALYERLGKTSKSLQYLAGELMAGNEELIRRLQTEGGGFTVAESILKNGFTANQIEFLTSIEQELTEECQFCKRFDDINAVCFDFPELSFENARKKCAVHDRDIVHGCAEPV